MMKALFCRFIEMLEISNNYQTEVHWAKLSNDEQIVYKLQMLIRISWDFFQIGD